MDKVKNQPKLKTSETSSQSYVLELISKYGEDSLSYLKLERDLEYFFGRSCEGFIAYVKIGSIAVCLGDPVCYKHDLIKLHNEFKQFCLVNKLKICFCSISRDRLDELASAGYHISKYGEEAILDLNVYNTVGSSRAKLRQKLRRAEKFGIQIKEYLPSKYRNFELEEKIACVSEQWYAAKNGRLTFTLGEINLENPAGRRYFLAIDQKEDVQAVLVFSPYHGGSGYFLDVMRRNKDAPPGTMEKGIIDSAMQMRAEGVSWVSLGIAPLAGLDNQEKMNLLERCLNFTFHHLNQNYGFKTLYDYKKKFSPTRWVPRYVAHEPGLSYFQVGCAMVRSRNVEDYWRQFIRGLWVVLRIAVERAVKPWTQRFSSQENVKINCDKQNYLLIALVWAGQFLT